ncbi:TetR/AcrR family transcriptional regulator [Clavibacter sp. VKM Ac-2542]|uniref:TetR/AcrR family transcriptional regulator n=1 Tax=Clavibacter sp. VKM Ac-2542 TaxID=2783811 RepID=UPI00280BC268|nr:TetR/AcrR family transcriptional regulator [Clavibacter sp. VKM Ac-2542]
MGGRAAAAHATSARGSPVVPSDRTVRYSTHVSLPSPSARPERVRAVLDAATDMLIEQGYAALTIDKVAARAHASKATIYKSWPTKTDLICAVAADVTLVPVPEQPLERSSADALTDIAEAVVSVTRGRNGRLLLALHEASRAEPRIAEAVSTHLVTPQHEAIATAIRSLQQQSRVANGIDPAVASRVISSVIIDRALVSGQPLEGDELRRVVTQWLIPAMSPRAVSGRTAGPTAGPG